MQTVSPVKTSKHLEIKKKKKKWKHTFTICMFIAPALFIYGLYVLYPILSTFQLSLSSWDGNPAGPTFIGLDNYIRLLSDPIFFKALRNNILVVLTSVFIQIPLGLILALLLFAPLKGLRVFSTVYFMPFLMSTVAIGLLWIFIFDPINGPLNKFIQTLGMKPVAWLGSPDTAMFSVLLVIVWQFAPFYMILFKAAMVGIPDELYESASIDGATGVKKFIYITLPLLIPTMVTSSILAIVGSLKQFDLFYIMTGGGPSNATELMGTYMYKNAFLSFNMGYASTIAFTMFLIAFIVTVIIQVLEYYRRKKGVFS
ncbi:raffinose/stachyose/melibiose transport system permease protein [Evansella vedderi]|uniref:Raffinose/stachyose/melibiose transport system permease protein n=1 Tax=Evansella vedderi TaxID=38282 RepID=A0ABT9ZSL4_9BACI|nr:sugar ABC transporter permease [Evansella vedderi]MDQ0253165.1 raffinose/stachyose/melibiose transport system permease protein [Evansella vedderi]